MESRTSSNFGQHNTLTTELTSRERLKQIMHKCLDEFEFRPDPITDYGGRCPLAWENGVSNFEFPPDH